jgi:hypothetical protein
VVTTIAFGLVLAALSAQAERRNGDAPEQDTPCEAADLVSAAQGLCDAYCEAMDCDGDDPRASHRACESVLENWDEHADGRTIPCEQVECPCWSSSDELKSVHSSNTLPGYGRVNFRICFENEDDQLIGVSDSTSDRARIESFVSSRDGACATEVLPFRQAVIPVLKVDDLTEFEIEACSQVIEGVCP